MAQVQTSRLYNDWQGYKHTHSSRTSGRDMGELNDVTGWRPTGDPIGQWMQIDLRSDRLVDGVVTQVSDGAGYAVKTFKVQYATSANPGSIAAVPGLFRSTNAAEWAVDKNHKTTQMLPKVITVRYIRFVIESVRGKAGLRAAVLLHSPKTDMFSGKHEFRRCLASDRYMKLVTVGTLTKKSGKMFRVGIFLDFVWLTTRTPHGAYVRRARRNRVDRHGGEIERLALQAGGRLPRWSGST